MFECHMNSSNKLTEAFLLAGKLDFFSFILFIHVIILCIHISIYLFIYLFILFIIFFHLLLSPHIVIGFTRLIKYINLGHNF